MASALYGTGRAGITLSGPGSGQQINWSDGDFNPLTEAATQRPITNATVTSGLNVRTTFDDTTTGNTLVIVRISGVDDPSGQQISVAAGTGGGSGWVQTDTSHTSAVAATNLVNFRSSVATGGTGVKYSFVGMVSTPTAGNTIHAYCLTNTSTTGTSNTFYFAPGSTVASAADTETGTQQLKTRNAGVLQNLTYRIGGNTRTTNCTWGVRVNGVNDPNILITIVPTDNNIQVSETSHTAAIVVGDLWDTYTTGGLGVGTLSALTGAIEIASTNAMTSPVATPSGPASIANNTTVYQLPQAKTVFSATNETFQKMRAGVAGVSSLYALYVITNTLTATSTLTMRKNGADVGGIISVPASTTAWVEDTSHIDAFIADDDMTWQFVTGLTGTAIGVCFQTYNMDMQMGNWRNFSTTGVG